MLPKPEQRPARSFRLRPILVIGVLIAGSAAAQLLPAEPAGASPPSTIAPIPAERFADVDVPPAPSPTPVGALGARPSFPVETAEPTPTPTPAPPEVVRFRPRHGSTDASPWAALSVRFTQPMDHASTEAAFLPTVGKTEVTGSTRWAEGDTVLVLQPSSALPYGADVQLLVAAGARSLVGGGLASATSVTFTVAERPAPPTPAPAPATRTTTAWRWPLIGPITQKFGESLTKYGVHQGIDIDGDTGNAVRAARAGKVVVAGHWDECGGLQVHIDHGNGLVSWYRHLSRIDVKVGARVDVGAVIGAVGETGCALGSHLHFGIADHGKFVDPLRYLPPR